MKRIIIFAIVLAAIFIFVSIVTGYEKKNEELDVEYLIGMSQCNLGEPWRVQMNNEIMNAIEPYDNVKIIFKDAAQNNDKQIEDVKVLLDLGIDLLIISPNEAEPLTETVEMASEKVPVIVLDRGVNTDNYTMFIGANNVDIGFEAGKYIVDYAKGQDINVVEIAGLTGALPTVQRHNGFMEAIRAENNIHVTKTITADWLRDKAEDNFAQYLKTNEHVDVVYAHNDPMAFGAYKAMVAAGKSGIVFVGIDGLDGTNGGKELVAKGILEATFIYPTGGKEAIEYAMQILNGKMPEQKYVELNSERVTR